MEDQRILVCLSSLPLNAAQAAAFVADSGAGAVASFVGTARVSSSVTNHRRVVRLEYEAYPEMAEEQLLRISASVLDAHDILRIALMHRIGTVAIGEPSIVVAVSAAHRAAAFDACRAAVEAVKASLPVWKKEVYADGTAWVGAGA
jgi:molybdopterin synthase catalytic subunit